MMNCWDILVKDAFRIPRQTHKAIAATLVDMTTLKEEMMVKGAKLIKNNLSSPSMEVRMVGWLLLQDVTSTIGSNLKVINNTVGTETLLLSGGRIRDILKSKRMAKVNYKNKLSDLDLFLMIVSHIKSMKMIVRACLRS